MAQHAYQKTLNLPKTKFPSHSKLQKTLTELIPQSSQVPYKEQLSEFIDRINQLDSDSAKLKFIRENLFILHDGPPYANGDLHLGHALNKILKDIIVRYQYSSGKYVFYKPGWDCHGLPIELKVLKSLPKKDIETISPEKIRSMARKHALTAIDHQRKQFHQFAIFTDWNDPYITMDKKFEIDQLKIFQKMYHEGLILRQNKPVFWGTETKTALAESELEYNKSHESTSAYVKFPLTKQSSLQLIENLNIVQDTPCLLYTSRCV